MYQLNEIDFSSLRWWTKYPGVFQVRTPTSHSMSFADEWIGMGKLALNIIQRGLFILEPIRVVQSRLDYCQCHVQYPFGGFSYVTAAWEEEWRKKIRTSIIYRLPSSQFIIQKPDKMRSDLRQNKRMPHAGNIIIIMVKHWTIRWSGKRVTACYVSVYFYVLAENKPRHFGNWRIANALSLVNAYIKRIMQGNWEFSTM